MGAEGKKNWKEDRAAMLPVIRRLFMENARDPVGTYVFAIACLITVALSTAFTAWVMESVINEAFTPSTEAIEHATAVVDAFAAAGNTGVVGLDGRMYDRPHLRRAERLLARSSATRHQASRARGD